MAIVDKSHELETEWDNFKITMNQVASEEPGHRKVGFTGNRDLVAAVTKARKEIRITNTVA